MSPGSARARARLRNLFAYGALLSLVVRLAIPAGFMPASDRPFALVLCPDGLPAQVLAADFVHPASHGGAHHDAHHDGHDDAHSPAHPGTHRHPGGSAHSEHCIFTSGSSSAPPSAASYAPVIALLFLAPTVHTLPTAAGVRLVYTPPARAPPRSLA